MEALPLIGAIGSAVGTGVSAMSAMNQSHYQAAVDRNNAVLQQQKANEDAAIGERSAITEDRRANLVLSRARAIAASSGTDPASPTQVTLEGGIEQQGGYNALSALYDGLARSRGDTEQAQIDLFRANQASAAGPLAATGALFGGLGRTASSIGSSPTLLKLFGA